MPNPLIRWTGVWWGTGLVPIPSILIWRKWERDETSLNIERQPGPGFFGREETSPRVRFKGGRVEGFA